MTFIVIKLVSHILDLWKGVVDYTVRRETSVWQNHIALYIEGQP